MDLLYETYTVVDEDDKPVAEVLSKINLDDILGSGNSTLTLTSGAS